MVDSEHSRGHSADTADILVGTVVAGRYFVERRLAAGGMGVVYEATQRPLGRRIALKVIRGDAVDDEVARLRFEREAKTASSLQDPHVVVIYDFGVLDTARGLYIAMEFVDGETLRAHLANEGRLSWRRSLIVVEQVARALAAAHSKGLVHRDLKPENIMLVPQSGDGVGGFSCKVLDFGLAKGVENDLLKHSGGAPLTRSGGFVGTPGYISPEHIDGAGEDPRQDVYALGVVWWELLTGRHPFPAETPMKTLLRQMHEEPPAAVDVVRVNADVPDAGAALVRELMAKNPRERPRDGGAVLARLNALLRGSVDVDSNAPTQQGMRPLSSPQPPPLTDVALIQKSGEHGTDVDSAPGALTIDGRGPRLVGANAAPAASASASAPSASSSSSSTPPTSTSTPTSAPSTSLRPRRRTQLWAGVALTSAVGTVAGVVIVKGLETPPLPPPVVAVVDAGVVAHAVRTEVVFEGLPSFSAVKAARDLLPPHTLKVYRPSRSEVVIDGDVGNAIADAVEGKVLVLEGGSLRLGVTEVNAGRVVVVAVAADEDAGVVGDAGVVAAPGGLAEP